MSFQHFRVPIAPHPTQEGYHTDPGPSSYHSADPSQTSAAYAGQIQTNSAGLYQHDLQPVPNPTPKHKGPYGSGDIDDGYTLCFPSMQAFKEWRQKEEDEKMIEFVKGDSHHSRADPPRFKEHTKLVCARHSRSGRKKYVKKYPDRVRKVPSRKLEGQGCPASISYKTYHESDQVRVCYVSEHSHPTGLENLPFTRRGRKAQADRQPRRSRARTSNGSNTGATAPAPIPESEQSQSPTSPSSFSDMTSIQIQSPVHMHQQIPSTIAPPSSQSSQPPYPSHASHTSQRPTASVSPTGTVSNIPAAIPDNQPYISTQVHHQSQQRQVPAPSSTSPYPSADTNTTATLSRQQILAQATDTLEARWDRMDAIFQHIRDTSRSFTFSPASVAMLESVLWRMYSETPPIPPGASPMSMLPLSGVPQTSSGINGVNSVRSGGGMSSAIVNVVNSTVHGAPRAGGHVTAS